jgi:2-methylisocitrate lyase-like PEP mutase family enzyme
MSLYETFAQMHHQTEPLLLANVWNAHTAKIFEKNGYQAIGTSSAAVANTLGYEDGENISFEELLFVVERIVKSVKIPVSVDLEAGYGKTLEEIVQNIKKLIALGVVGINLEDSTPQENKMIDMNDYVEKVKFIKSELAKDGLKLFINARTDAFLLGLPSPLEETLKRITVYQLAGADSIFVPCIVEKADIAQVVSATNLPINVMCMPNLPSFDELAHLGVKRVSMGNMLSKNLYRKLEASIRQINQDRSFDSLFVKN